MNHFMSALMAFYIAIGLSGGDAGKTVRFLTVVAPLVMAHAIDIPAGNAIIHWHLF